MRSDTKFFIALVVIVVIAATVALSICLSKKPSNRYRMDLKVSSEPPILANVERIGTAPTCNPELKDCQSRGMVMIGTCAVPSANSIVYGPCRDDNCDVYGHHAFCTNTVYPSSETAVWMAKSNLGNRALNSIPMIASHDTATYALPLPDTGISASIALALSSVVTLLIAVVFPLGAPLAFIGAIAGLESTLPVYNNAIVNFGPDAQEAYRNVVMWNRNPPCFTLPDPFTGLSDAMCQLAGIVSQNTLERIVKGVAGAWSRAQSATIAEQLTNGARAFDLRVCIDNAQETIPDAQLVFDTHVKFTHGLVCEITAVKFFTDIRDWIEQNQAHGEFILLDFNNLHNLVEPKEGTWMYVGEEKRLAFQRQFLQLLQNLFGSKLAPAGILPNMGYSDFVSKGYQIIATFNNAESFVSKWQAEFPFVRDRNNDLQGTWRDTLSDPVPVQAINVSVLSSGGLDPNKFTVINGSGGLGGSTAAKDILMGIFFPSQITGPNGLEQLSMKFTPNFVTSVLPPPYGHVPGQGWDRLPAPAGGYNFVSCDHFQKYNVTSLMIAWNRDELHTYGMRAIPTTNDDQCKCANKTISGGSVFDCGLCYTDPAGYDDTTCVKDGLECYSTTAPQCKSNADCYLNGQCRSHTGGGLKCNYGTNLQCNCENPHIETGQPCPDRVDKQCLNGTCAQFPEDNYVCCPSGTQVLGAVSQFCSNLNTNDSCKYDRQCRSGACGRMGNSDSPLVCCPGGNKTVWARDYCVGINSPSGTPCRSDDQCASGNCKGNGYGVKDGNCA